MNDEERAKLLETFAAQLGEHFDAVQILVSWNEGGLSNCIKRGCGNWWARQGMAHEFINEDVAQDNAIRIAGALQPQKNEPEDGDEWKRE